MTTRRGGKTKRIVKDIKAHCMDVLVQEDASDDNHAHDGPDMGVDEDLGKGKRLKVKAKWLKDFV